MSQSHVRQPNSFGEAKQLHSIVITRNGRSREYRVNPLLFTVLAIFLAVFGVGYISATTYLILRDDLNAMRASRNVRIQYEYEDRITALRSNLDRVTSRQLLDQQAIETKVAELIERQKLLGEQGPVMKSIMKKAGSLGLALPGNLAGNLPSNLADNLDGTGNIYPVPGGAKQQKKANSSPEDSSQSLSFFLRGLGEEQNLALDSTMAKNRSVSGETLATSTIDEQPFDYDANSLLFAKVANSIRKTDTRQKQIITSLRKSAEDKLTKFAKLASRVGVEILPPIRRQISGQIRGQTKGQAGLKNGGSVGGPFEPLDSSSGFNSQVEALKHTFVAVERARANINLAPLAHPVPGSSVSSRFGSRLDPFKGSYAMHSGMDFRAKTGTAVKATAAGLVIHAGRDGGYGKLVEIKHANGLTTKYAHLSKILVTKGQKVKAGAIIAKVGSTGRSTGPHLHYEIRRYQTAVDPKTYLGVGKKLVELL